jgi:hypothetical protein
MVLKHYTVRQLAWEIDACNVVVTFRTKHSASYELRIAEWHFHYTNVKAQFHLYVCVVSRGKGSFSWIDHKAYLILKIKTEENNI